MPLVTISEASGVVVSVVSFRLVVLYLYLYKHSCPSIPLPSFAKLAANMKLISLITVATTALAAVGDKYKLTYTRSDAQSVESLPVTYQDDLITASTDGEPITITEGEGNTFSVNDMPIAYLELQALFWTGDYGYKLQGSVFDIAADGTFELRDGPKEYYYCTPHPERNVIYVINSPDYSKCRFKRTIKFHAEKI
ncbi:hypothetical protein B0I73DRAFT_163464 [Yarrowia lipolytica]|jgi:hypothetical protein|uniref:YALI0C01001p n=2 Tax=Yarrowia lipolytica TaxID=4952 RepID=Q6CDF2_YARLI|nr:YALI0C01001p [Yarrowia lipolytica CLIB122]AOW02172.1 hypothetical protein YALI1_C01393g [Yarrowia lipolytica]KAB8283606.1 hypothetical protein BKA91DRAFT_161994 [Yarrowia lipolytica]KAE8170986.1 hypothetical protein BKA90DRAFT_158141 [Yarrowia lipolytica]KAJ8052928.1 hypothetical protein LXG23DRAFT_49238 [Yarrowia lipolytica]RDW36808.1 hypothetical protein B0I73DRAFT_163464 [Yarrowia lipolytica]|eukprot:XP_501310.2 YALI0C01001p [Yarrowia lipolytica CLIB122]